MKKVFTRACLAVLLLFASFPLASSANTENVTPESSALSAALFQVVLDQKTNEQSEWKGKKVSVEQPIPVYDTTGDIYSYIVNLSENGESAGFVEISASKDEYPILSYGYDQKQLDEQQQAIFTENRTDKKKKINSKKAVIVGPGAFALKVDYEDGTADIIDEGRQTKLSVSENKRTEKVKKPYNEESRKLWKTITDEIAGEIGTDSDGVTDSLSFETSTSTSSYYLSYVPDVNQYNSSLWVGPSGCSPTSAYNIMKYWKDTQGRSNLLATNANGTVNQDQTILELRQAMGTDNNGSTTISNIAPGMKSYAQSKGYTATQNTITNFTWSAYKSLFYPQVISFTNQTYYSPGGGHSVTSVGYIEYFYNNSSAGHQYMEVHDNWGNTPFNVYVAYGRNYTNIYLSTIVIS